MLACVNCRAYMQKKTAQETRTPNVRPSACCPCLVASTWSSWSFWSSWGPLEQDPSRECTRWVNSYPQCSASTPTTKALWAQTLQKTWSARSLLASCQEKASCKHFLVVEEKNRPSVYARQLMNSVYEKNNSLTVWCWTGYVGVWQCSDGPFGDRFRRWAYLNNRTIMT